MVNLGKNLITMVLSNFTAKGIHKVKNVKNYVMTSIRLNLLQYCYYFFNFTLVFIVYKFLIYPINADTNK